MKYLIKSLKTEMSWVFTVENNFIREGWYRTKSGEGGKPTNSMYVGKYWPYFRNERFPSTHYTIEEIIQ